MSLRDWAELAVKLREHYDNNRFWEAPTECYTVSKTFKAEGENLDPRSSVCGTNGECIIRHTGSRFVARELEPHDCDSEFSQKHLQGTLNTGIQMAFGHVSDVPFAGGVNDFWEKRGVFYGGFDVFDRRGDPVVEGHMDGMINVGPVRDPLRNPSEKCHMPGRWHGRVNGRIALPDKEFGILTGVIAMDVTYDNKGSAFKPNFVCTLEGMIVRECGFR